MALHARRYGAPSLGCCLVGAALATTAPARAAPPNPCHPPDGYTTCLPADTLWPSLGGTWVTQPPTSLLAPRQTALGLATTYLHRPIGLRIASPDPEGTTVYAVEHALDATLLASVGVAPRLSLDLAMPVTLYQLGASKADVVGSDQTLPRSAVGDLRFGVTVALWARAAEADGWAVASRLHVTAPTGDRDAFTAAPSAAFAPAITADFRAGRFSVGADAGARLRRYAQLAGAIVGNQLSLSLGAAYEILAGGWLGARLEASSLFTLEQQTEFVAAPGDLIAKEQPSSDPHIPAEWLFGLQCAHFMDRTLVLHAAAGTLIPTGPSSDVTAPAVRAVLSLAWRPRGAATARSVSGKRP